MLDGSRAQDASEAVIVAKKLRQQTDRIVKECEFEKVPRDIFSKLGGMS